ncbi:MAG: hypothetical protein WB784_04695 [Rhodanobacteraceae bacterium]
MSSDPHNNSELPTAFDSAIYRSANADLKRLSEADLANHYSTCGVVEGRVASAITGRTDFIALINRSERILEIGPFANPALRGPQVVYFDVLTTEQLKERAVVHSLDPDNCPAVDYVSPTGDLSIVPPGFGSVFSSHAIEHQPDLVRHLREVADLLDVGRRYFLAVPDKRYCFDHFNPESTIADVIDAHVNKRVVHTAASHVRQAGMITHNDPARHWQGDHGEPEYRSDPKRLSAGVQRYVAARGSYVDVHAWQFTPKSFGEIIDSLHEIGLSDLRVARIYPGTYGSIEFFAVLEKGEPKTPVALDDLPADFDEARYLLANPDVARAGVDAVTHYLTFGRREGRRIRL